MTTALPSTTSQSPSNLPEGWRTVHFGDVVRNADVYVSNPLESGLDRYIGLDHLDPESLHIKRWGLIADGTSFTRKFTREQVLFGKRRAYQRKAAVADFDGICSGDILVFEPKGDDLLPDLLPFIVQSEGFYNYALVTSAGSLSPRTRWRDMAEYKFPLPPKHEQRRIADILWAAEHERRVLLTVLDRHELLIAALARATFHEASNEEVLFDGLLRNGSLAFQTGPFGTVLKASSYVETGTPVINPTNMIEGKLHIENGPFINVEECLRLSKYRMEPGDIILGRKGDVGRAVYVTADHNGYIIGSDLIRLRLNTPRIRSEYMYRFLISPPTRNWIISQSSGTTMLGMNERILGRLSISVPNPEKQLEIVRMFQDLDDTKQHINNKINACVNLRRSLIRQLLSSVTSEFIAGVIKG